MRFFNFLAHSGRSYVIMCIYHPPKPLYSTPTLLSHLISDLEHLLRTHADAIFIVAGDFNRLDTGFLSDQFGLQQLYSICAHTWQEHN